MKVLPVPPGGSVVSARPGRTGSLLSAARQPDQPDRVRVAGDEPGRWREFGIRSWRRADTPVASAARGRWCLVSSTEVADAVRLAPLIRVDFLDALGEPAGGRLNLRRNIRARGASGVCFVPERAEWARLEVVGVQSPPASATLSFRPIGTATATAKLLAAHPSLAGMALGIAPALFQRGAAKARLRGVLERAVAAEAPPVDYRRWCAAFDTWPPGTLPTAEAAPSLGFLVFGGPDTALHATLEALDRQARPAAPRILVQACPGAVRSALQSLPGVCDYVGIVQAGEILPPHASLLARAWLAASGLPPVAYADEDELSARDGSRISPVFKPEPSRALMASGTLSRGLWLARRALLASFSDDLAGEGRWAEACRLDGWLRLHEAGGSSRRIPFILAHRRPDTPAAPPGVLAGVVAAHLDRAGLPFDVKSGWPLRVTAQLLPSPDRIAIVVPSALRSPKAEACIKAVLAGTRHSNFELLVAVSQPGPLDAAQREAAARIEADGRARVVALHADSFNYSWVNNRAVGLTQAGHILLLNDDVTPIAPDWLNTMAAHLADPAVGVVGAKLLYPDGTVQHGGVIMGLAGLCDHAYRHGPGGSPGYAHRAMLAQELSAVTGACLLVRREVLEAVGGLDEGYPSAFNDVDFCLRIREAGWAVVLAPDALLRHDEHQTYHSHYAGERAGFRQAEVARMRTRWAGVIADDPFHSPNLGLLPGSETAPAFPPRLVISALIGIGALVDGE